MADAKRSVVPQKKNASSKNYTKKHIHTKTINDFSDIDFDMPASRKTVSEIKAEHAILMEKIEFFMDSAYCRICGNFKRRELFYQCSDPLVKSGVTPICRQCAKDIANRKDKNGDYHPVTKESLINALRYLDKPYIETVYNSSLNEIEAGNSNANTIDAAYFKNIQMPQYYGLTYADSDFYKEKIVYEDEKDLENIDIGDIGQLTRDRSDVIRLLHYDPFEHEAIEDQPFLYSQLLGMLDSSEDANDDMMRTSSAINIVRCFLQISKIDNAIARLMGDPGSMARNAGTIKSMQESKQKMTSMITSLAEESCLSLQHSKHATKGENTWTGKLKKIKDLNLREGEVNGFDMETCRGMRQVMDASNQSILKALKLDESEYSDMLAEQREMIVDLNRKLSNYREISRILLRENLDLKNILDDKGMLDVDNLIDLEELYSVYGDNTAETDEMMEDIGGGNYEGS